MVPESFERIPLDAFASTIGTQTELSSVALGGKIISVSDEFFAEAENLLKVEPAPSLKGQFGPKGSLFSGWETRRHNPTFDWAIIKLGAPGQIVGFDIDTAHFSGNEAPEASVEALFDVDGGREPGEKDARWTEILPKVALGPNSRHLFKLDEETKAFNYVKLKMYPDGGIARFRVYGLVSPVFPKNSTEPLDLAHVFAGGRVVKISDQHFGQGSNLLLPGRGKDMGDGWETRRSRSKGHTDWVIIKLGVPGYLDHAEIDTAHYMGNYPESVELHAIYSEEIIPDETSLNWTTILPRTKVGPHRRHFFQLPQPQLESKFSHVRLTMYPDGGVKRVRIIGRREIDLNLNSLVSVPSDLNIEEMAPHTSGVNGLHGVNSANGVNGATKTNGTHTNGHANGTFQTQGPTIHALPLTAVAFAPFGHVLEAHASPASTPRDIRVTGANQGSAMKFHALAPILSSYPSELSHRAHTALSVYRCKGLPEERWTEDNGGFSVKLLERHAYTNQAFVPMGVGLGSSVADLPSESSVEDDALERSGRAYLVIVAHNDEDGKPDVNTLRAFIAGAGQGIVYSTAVWHHPMIALESTIDFVCAETQLGDGSTADCEIVELDSSEGLPRVLIPKFL